MFSTNLNSKTPPRYSLRSVIVTIAFLMGSSAPSFAVTTASLPASATSAPAASVAVTTASPPASTASAPAASVAVPGNSVKKVDGPPPSQSLNHAEKTIQGLGVPRGKN